MVISTQQIQSQRYPPLHVLLYRPAWSCCCQVTIHHSPFTTNHSPFTIHHSLFTQRLFSFNRCFQNKADTPCFKPDCFPGQPFPGMQALKTGLSRDSINLRCKEISHGMGFIQFRDGMRVSVAYKHMVVYIHPVFIGMKNRFGQAGDPGLIIRHPFDADRGRSVKTAGPYQTSKMKMPPGFRCCLAVWNAAVTSSLVVW